MWCSSWQEGSLAAAAASMVDDGLPADLGHHIQHFNSPRREAGRRSAGRTRRGTWHTGNTTLSLPASKTESGAAGRQAFVLGKGCAADGQSLRSLLVWSGCCCKSKKWKHYRLLLNVEKVKH